MMLPSRLGCPLSLKTPNMGNTGLLPVASAIAPPVIPEAVPGGIRERQPEGLGRGMAWPQDVVGGASVEKSVRSGLKSYCVQGGVDM